MARDYGPLMGKSVVITWRDSEGVENSAAGVFHGFAPETDGSVWACLDWGYGVNVKSVDFDITLDEDAA